MGIALIGFLTASVIGLVSAAIRLVPSRRLSVGGEVFHVAPSPAAFSDAVRLHADLMRWLGASRAVYVLGGMQHGLPAGASRLTQRPLAAQALPRLGSLDAGLPLDAYAFHKTYRSTLGEPGGEGHLFSVLVVGAWEERLAVTALVQVRKTSVSPDGHPADRYTLWEVTLDGIDGLSTRYAFLEPPSSAAQARVEAHHFWYRYAEGLVAEEGPVVAFFPDPLLYAGDRSAPEGVRAEPQPASFSRFVYVLPVSS